MTFELAEVLNIGTVVVAGVVLLTRVESRGKEAASQISDVKNTMLEQHREMKLTAEERARTTNLKLDGLSGAVARIDADLREHAVRIEGIEGRTSRTESHVDQMGQRIGIGRMVK